MCWSWCGYSVSSSIALHAGWSWSTFIATLLASTPERLSLIVIDAAWAEGRSAVVVIDASVPLVRTVL